MKQDIREHSDQELSLWVFNDEGLYIQRHRRDFLATVAELFEYTPEQLEVLKQDLEDDASES